MTKTANKQRNGRQRTACLSRHEAHVGARAPRPPLYTWLGQMRARRPRSDVIRTSSNIRSARIKLGGWNLSQCQRATRGSLHPHRAAVKSNIWRTRTICGNKPATALLRYPACRMLCAIEGGTNMQRLVSSLFALVALVSSATAASVNDLPPSPEMNFYTRYELLAPD